MRFFISIYLFSVIFFARYSIAAACECYTATKWEYDASCKTACSESIITHVPTRISECAVTKTITSTSICSTTTNCRTDYFSTKFENKTIYRPWKDCTFATTSEQTVTATPPTTTPTSSGLQIPLPTSPGDCRPLPDYELPYDIPLNTSSDFLSAEILSNLAKSVKSPVGYQPAFVDKRSSVSADGFPIHLLKEQVLETYEPDECAFQCDIDEKCQSFNIFFQRVPIFVPSDTCPNPRATVRIVCTYWDKWVTIEMATYRGENRKDFYIGIAGSNAYKKYAPYTITDFPPSATEPEPTPSPTSKPSSTPKPSPTSTPSSSPKPSPTSTPSSSPKPSPTSTPSSSPKPSSTSTPSSTPKPSPTPTKSSSSTLKPTSSQPPPKVPSGTSGSGSKPTSSRSSLGPPKVPTTRT